MTKKQINMQSNETMSEQKKDFFHLDLALVRIENKLHELDILMPKVDTLHEWLTNNINNAETRLSSKLDSQFKWTTTLICGLYTAGLATLFGIMIKLYNLF